VPTAACGKLRLARQPGNHCRRHTSKRLEEDEPHTIHSGRPTLIEKLDHWDDFYFARIVCDLGNRLVSGTRPMPPFDAKINGHTIFCIGAAALLVSPP
jgi:hypothetical protein